MLPKFLENESVRSCDSGSDQVKFKLKVRPVPSSVVWHYFCDERQ